MASKANIIYRMDCEIEMYIDMSKGTPPDERMKKLEQYTSLRNCIDNMDLPEPFINAMEQTESMLELAEQALAAHKDCVTYWETAYAMVDDTYLSERKQLLCKIINDEYNSYLEWMKEHDRQFILDESYQTTAKKEILILLKESELPFRDIDTLLCIDNPLEYLYSDWLHHDGTHFDELLNSIKESIQKYDEYLQEYAPSHDDESAEIAQWNQMYDKDRLRDPDSHTYSVSNEMENEPEL